VSQSVLSLPRRGQPAILRLVPSGRSLVIAAALVLLAAGLYGLARETSMFAIRRIDVVGASPELSAQVRSALGTFSGTSLLRIDGAAVIRRADELPAVFSATYDRAFPHTLEVRVISEVPVAVLRRGSDSWLVSARGRVISTTDPTRMHKLPRIWLSANAQVDVGEILQEQSGAATARALAVMSSAGLAGEISWARITAGQLTARLRDGLELRLGPPVDIRVKVAIATAILATLAPPSVGGATYLDVSVLERPVAGRDSQPGG
jgi:cell division protein FtsQ